MASGYTATRAETEAEAEVTPAREAALRPYKQRTEAELRRTLSMLCNFIWTRHMRPGEHMWSIPVDRDRDFDCILTDAIDELLELRKVAALRAGGGEPEDGRSLQRMPTHPGVLIPGVEITMKDGSAWHVCPCCFSGILKPAGAGDPGWDLENLATIICMAREDVAKALGRFEDRLRAGAADPGGEGPRGEVVRAAFRAGYAAHPGDLGGWAFDVEGCAAGDREPEAWDAWQRDNGNIPVVPPRPNTEP